MVDKNKKQALAVTIYADGSARPNPGRGGWATILVFGDRVRMVVGEQESATNNEMEARAVMEGLKRLSMACMVTICTDSQYVRDGLRAVSFRRVFDTNIEIWKMIRDLYEKQVAVRVDEVVAHRSDTPILHKVCDRYSRWMARGNMKPVDRYVSLDEAIQQAAGQ